MNYFILLLCIFISLFSCVNNEQIKIDSSAIQVKEPHKKPETIYAKTILPSVTAYVEVDSSSKQWNYYIIVSDLKSNEQLQKLKVTNEMFMEKIQPLEFVDMNFDRFSDIIFPTEISADGNRWNQCWLYDTVNKKYIFHKQLSELISPIFDSRNKIIKEGYWRGTSEQNGNTFTFVNNNLKLIKNESFHE